MRHIDSKQNCLPLISVFHAVLYMNDKLHIKAFLGLAITLVFEHLLYHPKTWEGLVWVNLLSMRKPVILSQIKIEMKTEKKQTI